MSIKARIFNNYYILVFLYMSGVDEGGQELHEGSNGLKKVKGPWFRGMFERRICGPGVGAAVENHCTRDYLA